MKEETVFHTHQQLQPVLVLQSQPLQPVPMLPGLQLLMQIQLVLKDVQRVVGVLPRLTVLFVLHILLHQLLLL